MKCVNEILEDFYSKYAFIVYRYAWVFIIVPVALTGCLATGFMFLTERTVNDTNYIMTPTDGPHIKEYAVIAETWPMDELRFFPGYYVDMKHYLYIVAFPKNGKKLLSNETLSEIQKLNDFIQNRYTLKSLDGKYNFTYSDICLTWGPECFANSHVYMLRNREQYESNGGKVTWPITRELYSNVPLYLGSLLASVTVNASDGYLLDAMALRMVYYTKQKDPEFNTYSLQWRTGMQDYLLNYKSDVIDLAFANEDTLNQGLDENAYRFAPQIVVTVSLVFLFSYLCSYMLMKRKDFVGIDWVRSKPLLACVGVAEPGLAIISTMGFLLLCGMPYNPIVVVMPFLVFAIGVDDMFIMIAAWQGTKRDDPPAVRFSQALAEAAVSISITSITDVLSFGIGAWNSLPGVQIFCVFTAVAMFFELLYQCTFYAGALALIGKAESDGRHCVTFRKAVPYEEAKTWWQKRFQTGSVWPKTPPQSPTTKTGPKPENGPHTFGRCLNDDEHHNQDLTYVQKFFRNKYGPILLHPATKAVAALLFIAYIGFSAWGLSFMQSGLDPLKMVYKGHYSHKMLVSDVYFDVGQQISVTVSRPPNLTFAEERQNMLKLASAFENTNYTLGEKTSVFWLREYLFYMSQSFLPEENTRLQWCYNLKDWLKTDTYGSMYLSIRWGNESLGEDECWIKAFRFFVCAKNFSRPNLQQKVVPYIRNIAKNYSQYDVSTFNDYIYPYVDQYLIINYITTRNLVLSFAVMIAISLLLIPHPVCGVFITLSTVSIDSGVGGFLAWWGVSLDCVSMITMIMATGFAVDLSAHVSYAYVRSVGTAKERAIQALESLGWPVFQGVTSTFLGVLVLGLVESYMFQVFFKTVFLVIIFGLMHSIIFLPVALTTFAPKHFTRCCKEKTSRKRTNVLAPTNGVVAPVSFVQTEPQK